MFLAMVFIQAVVMPVIGASEFGDVYFGLSQVYMGVFMGAAMVAIDGWMYPYAVVPWWLWVVIAGLMVSSVIAYRWQLFVTDKAFLQDMIPHHSMALVMAKKKAKSTDPFVSRLAAQILIGQTKEIVDMKRHLATI